MKQRWENEATVQGRLYDAKLRTGINKDGVGYVSGNVMVATDENMLNIVRVQFYSLEKWSSGKHNDSYDFLQGIVNGTVKTVSNGGAQSAPRVNVRGEVDVNDYFNQNAGDVVSAKQIRGRFINATNSTEGFARFDVEGVFNGASIREFDDGDTMTLRGYIFNWKHDFLPLSVVVRNPAGIAYFTDLDLSNNNPFVMKVFGQIVTNTISRKNEVETAWGTPIVSSTERSFQSWELDGSVPTGEFGDESVLTIEEVNAGLQAREMKLATIRSNAGSGGASAPSTFVKQTAAPVAPVVAPADDSDDFEF